MPVAPRAGGGLTNVRVGVQVLLQPCLAALQRAVYLDGIILQDGNADW